MTASTFDALTATRELEAAGIERRQAEAIAEGMRRAATADHDELATKGDIAALKGDIASVHARLNLLQWVVGIQSAIVLATFAIVAAKLL